MSILGTLVSSVDLKLDPPDYKLRHKAAPTIGPTADLAVLVTG